MTPEEFNDAYALCQFLPGPNVVNLSVVFGRRIRGAVGSAVALLGLLGPPFVIVTLIGLLYAQFGEIAALQRMLMGVAAAAVGLVMGTCAKMALPLFKDPLGLAPLLALATLVVGRRPALAAVLGAGRAHPAEHRDRLGAAMKDDGGMLLTLAGYFAVMSLFAIGGANSAVPEMQRVAVEVEHWMTARQFSDIFAIAQVTPGPNVIIVTLIGYHVAGSGRRTGRDAGDVRAHVAVRVLCRPRLGALQGRAVARCDPGRIASDFDRADRGERHRGGIGDRAQFCGSGYDVGDGGRDLHDAVESPVDFCRGGTARTRRAAVNLN